MAKSARYYYTFSLRHADHEEPFVNLGAYLTGQVEGDGWVITSDERLEIGKGESLDEAVLDFIRKRLGYRAEGEEGGYRPEGQR